VSDQGSISHLIDQIVSEGLQAEVPSKPVTKPAENPDPSVSLPQGLTVIADDFEKPAEAEVPKKVSTGYTGSYSSRLWNTTHYFAEKILRNKQS
jgi:hypothetical protein